MVPVIIVLLIIGCMLILSSFLFRDALSGQSSKNIMTEQEIENLVERRFGEAKYRLNDEAEKSADMIKDQTERELERLSNEKIMAVNEYSDQVMDQINKNHSEVMFLYGMLNDKQKELDHAVEKLNRMNRQVDEQEKLAQHKKQEKAVKDEQPKEAAAKPKAAAKKKPAANSSQEQEKYTNKAKILQMAEEGNTAHEIAKQLNLGVGEVRLVLELSKERKSET